MRKLKYYFFCLKWLYRNRTWGDSRQKFNALRRALIKEMEK